MIIILVELLLYGCNKFYLEEQKTIKASIRFIINSERFSSQIHNKFRKIFWPIFLSTDIK